MKLIFLDVDGVLNSLEFMRKTVQINSMCTSHDIDPIAVERVKQIIDGSNASIVISSSWRIILTLPELQNLLAEFGIDRDKVIGVTPRLNVPRGGEIIQYIETFPLASDKIESFVILDDDGDMEPVAHRLVHTSFNFGLRDEDIQEALKILNEPWEPELELA